MEMIETTLTILVAIQGVLLLIPRTVVWVTPGTKWGDRLLKRSNGSYANGRNWPCFVAMNTGCDYRQAVRAQELYESEVKRWIPVFLYTRTHAGQRWLELMGHEIEVQKAVREYGVNEHDYRLKEASSMLYGYEGFRAWGIDQIYQGMLKNKQKALDYLDRENI